MKKLILITALLFNIVALSQEIVISNPTISDSIFDNKSIRPFEIVENVPIYKGCENLEGNALKKKCLQQKIGEHFKANFNSTISNNSTLKSGTYRVLVNFKVNQEGSITDIRTNISDETVKNEVKRIFKLMPQLKPGIHKGKPVTVPFSIPFILDLEKDKNIETKNPVFKGCEDYLTNKELDYCTEEKIIEHIHKNFNYKKAKKLFINKEEKGFFQNIEPIPFKLDFIINKKGEIENIKTDIEKQEIANEIIKLVNKLPKFKQPGTINGLPTNMPFSLQMTLNFF